MPGFDNIDGGIRGRRVSNGSLGEVQQINGEFEGDQHGSALGSSSGFVAAAWLVGSRLYLRYLDANGAPVSRPFGDGTDAEFTVQSSGVVGRPVVYVGDRVYVLWTEGACGEGGGSALRLRSFPRPW